VNAPARIGQSSGHGRSRGRAPMIAGAQRIMDDTTAGHAADQRPAGGDLLCSLCSVPTTASHASQPLATGGSEPFKKRRREHVSSFRLLHACFCVVKRSLGQTSSDLEHSPLLRPCNERGHPDLWSGNERHSSSASHVCGVLPESTPHAARRGCPPVCRDQDWSHRSRTASNLSQHSVSPSCVARQADDSCQPYARRDHHGHHASSVHLDVIGLHIDQIQAGVLNDCVMPPLAALSRSISSVYHGSFIQPVGVYHGLHGTARRQPCHNTHDHTEWFAQALDHRSSPRAQRLCAGAPPILLPLTIMNPERVRSAVALCGKHHFRAADLRCVHRLMRCFFHTHITPMDGAIFTSLPLFHRFGGLYPYFSIERESR
jgi:hypothetical protein